jgi:hypothetical protein
MLERTIRTFILCFRLCGSLQKLQSAWRHRYRLQQATCMLALLSCMLLLCTHRSSMHTFRFGTCFQHVATATFTLSGLHERAFNKFIKPSVVLWVWRKSFKIKSVMQFRQLHLIKLLPENHPRAWYYTWRFIVLCPAGTRLPLRPSIREWCCVGAFIKLRSRPRLVTSHADSSLELSSAVAYIDWGPLREWLLIGDSFRFISKRLIQTLNFLVIWSVWWPHGRVDRNVQGFGGKARMKETTRKTKA